MGHNIFDPYGLREKAAGFGGRLGRGVRNLGSVFPQGSRLSSAFEDVGSFVEDLPSFAYEVSPFGMSSGLTERATSFLLDPSKPAAKPAPKPTVQPAPAADPGGIPYYLARPSATPDMDAAPDDGLSPVMDPMTGQNMPGVRISPSSLTARTAGDRQAIEGLRERGERQRAGLLRPLMALRGEGGGPLSSADMKINQAAMDQLDDFFTNATQAQRIQALTDQAKEQQAEMLAEDPFALQRAQAEIDMGKSFAQESYKAQLQQQKEQERRQAYGGEIQAEQAQVSQALEQAAREPDLAKRQELEAKIRQRYEERLQFIRQKYGLGAGMNAAFDDKGF